MFFFRCFYALTLAFAFSAALDPVRSRPVLICFNLLGGSILFSLVLLLAWSVLARLKSEPTDIPT